MPSNKKPRTKKELRIAIAKDVLLRLRTNKLIPASGVYVGMSYGAKAFAEANGSLQASQCLDTLTNNCRVCALGATFVSYVSIKNKISVMDFATIQQARREELLHKAFTFSQLYDIERCFEGWNDGYLWVECYPTARERMQAIMKNIIRNDGTFKPEKEPKVQRYSKKLEKLEKQECNT